MRHRLCVCVRGLHSWRREVWVQVGAGGFESRARRRRIYEGRFTKYEFVGSLFYQYQSILIWKTRIRR